MRTYGTLRYIEILDAKGWVIQTEPHVSMRLKALFRRIANNSYGTHSLSDTPEVAMDLKWFMVRYPMIITPEDRDRLESQAKLHADRANLVEQLLLGQLSPRPFKLAKPARDYQKVFAEVALTTRGILNADDVGTGKTVCSIASMTDARTRPALVVTLTHLPRQWEEKLKEFAPELTTHILKGTRPYDIRRREGFGKAKQLPDVIVTSYSKLPGWCETLAPIVNSVHWDEVQELRTGIGTKKYGAAKLIAENTWMRAGYSATPIHGYGVEFFNVMECLQPGALGSEAEFKNEWCIRDNDKWKIKNPKAFGTYLRESGLMLRRTRRDCGRELPAGEPIVIPHYIDADLNKLSEVSRSCAELAEIILKQGQSFKGEKMSASGQFDSKLRQATGIAKAPFVADFVKLLVEQGERVVLYGWHHEVYSIWMDRLKEYKPVKYTGKESEKQKHEALQKFIRKETPVLILSNRAGAGIDGLQHCCRTTVHGELDWAPAIAEQTIGRVARDGQLDVVTAYFLIAEVGSDPIMCDVLGIKKSQLFGAINPDAPLVEKLQMDPQHMRRLAENYLAQIGRIKKRS